MLLRRGRRHCARREREGGRGDGSREARWRGRREGRGRAQRGDRHQPRRGTEEGGGRSGLERGGAKGKGEDGARGLVTLLPRPPAASAPWSLDAGGGRSQGRLLGGSADWPRTL